VAASFDSVSQDWLVRFLEHRIGDPRIIRLIRKWLKAGVLEEGKWSVSETGTPQGAVISPLLANVYLHYVFDLWAKQWRRREATGNVIVVRYADDIVAGFEHEADARRFWDAMRTRFEQFGLDLHEEKTRLLEFGRYAADQRQQLGLGKPKTFTFLGFTFICGKSRRGTFQLQRKTRRDRMRAKLQEIKEQLRSRMHEAIPEQGRWLKAVVTGFFAYHAVPTNARALNAFRHYVGDLWRRTLRRRSEKTHLTWDRMTKLVADWLPPPRILHPWPDQRFAVKHLRWEPNARIGHVRICAGGVQKPGIPTVIQDPSLKFGTSAIEADYVQQVAQSGPTIASSRPNCRGLEASPKQRRHGRAACERRDPALQFFRADPSIFSATA